MDKILHSVRNGQIELLDRWNIHVETRPDINTDNVEELQGVAKVGMCGRQDVVSAHLYGYSTV